MARAWQAAAVAVVAVSGTVLVASRSHAYMDGTGPGAGFLPFWVGVLGIVTGIAIVFTVRLRGVDESLTWRVDRGPLGRIAVTVATLAAAAAVLDVAGFRVTAFVMLAVLLQTFGARSWWRLLVASAVGSLAVFQLFYSGFDVPLPLSIIGF